MFESLQNRLRDLINKRALWFFKNSYAVCTDNPKRFEMPEMICFREAESDIVAVNDVYNMSASYM